MSRLFDAGILIILYGALLSMIGFIWLSPDMPIYVRLMFSVMWVGALCVVVSVTTDIYSSRKKQS